MNAEQRKDDAPGYFKQAVERPYNVTALTEPASVQQEKDEAVVNRFQSQKTELREQVYGIQQRIMALRQAAANDTMEAHAADVVLLPDGRAIR